MRAALSRFLSSLRFFEDGRKLSVVEGCKICWFNLWLLGSTFILFCLSVFSLAPFGIWPRAVQRRVSGLLLRCCRLIWRWPFTASPWVRVDCEGLSAGWEGRIGASGRPVLLIANHTSFLDSLLFATHCNAGTVAQVATLANRSLFSIPLLGHIMRGVGHIPVHFKSSNKDNDFATDPTKKNELLDRVERHVADGGWLCFYPEGQIHRGHGSRNTATLQPLRIGGLGVALQYDMELWVWLAKGNNDCWPRTAVGGLPATIKASLTCIAPTGSRDLMRELEPNAPSEYGPEALKASLPVLVPHVQRLMQQRLDELYHSGEKARDA